MNKVDKEWLGKCKKYPKRYKIYVDNDCVSVCDFQYEDGEAVHTFSEYGYFFALQLLQYIGCNAEMV